MTRNRKIIIATTHPIQYQVPLFRELSKHLDLTVLFMMEQTPRGQKDAGFGVEFSWDIPMTDGFKYVWAKNIAEEHSSSKRKGIILTGIEDIFNKVQPEILIVFGWFPNSYLQLIKFAKKNNIRLMMRSESNLAERRSIAKKSLGEFYYRWLFSGVDKFLSIGKMNTLFYRRYGVREDNIFFAPYSIDTEFFEKRYSETRPSLTRTGKIKLGFSGKLIPKKCPVDLIRSVCKSAFKDQIEVVMIGDGPLRDKVKKTAKELGVSLDYRGFLNQSEIVEKGYFDLDCLVLPSAFNETWGLVVNEAMTGGIPAIVSDMVGSAEDLVIEGETGYKFQAGNVGELTGKIDKFICKKRDGFIFRDRVLETIEKYSLKKTAEGFLRCVQKI